MKRAQTLRKDLAKLAHSRPQLRSDLVPLLRRVAVAPRYVLMGIQVVYGENRVEWYVLEEDVELAKQVLRSMADQGERVFSQPTRRKPSPRDVTTRKDLLRVRG